MLYKRYELTRHARGPSWRQVNKKRANKRVQTKKAIWFEPDITTLLVHSRITRPTLRHRRCMSQHDATLCNPNESCKTACMLLKKLHKTIHKICPSVNILLSVTLSPTRSLLLIFYHQKFICLSHLPQACQFPCLHQP